MNLFLFESLMCIPDVFNHAQSLIPVTFGISKILVKTLPSFGRKTKAHVKYWFRLFTFFYRTLNNFAQHQGKIKILRKRSIPRSIDLENGLFKAK